MIVSEAERYVEIENLETRFAWKLTKHAHDTSDLCS
jgi:hypothetical protein